MWVLVADRLMNSSWKLSASVSPRATQVSAVIPCPGRPELSAT